MTMEPFSRLDAVAAPFDEPNIDTDRIVPARFLQEPRSQGFGGFLFHDARRRADGSQDPDFPLNHPLYRDAGIIVVNANFGCGSSREGAVWALVDSGIRAVIAPSFADIFYNNGFKNGLLPVRLPVEVVAGIRRQLHQQPGARIAIDLPTQTVTEPSGANHRFELDPFHKKCLLEGLDDIGITMQYKSDIAAFVERRRHEVPWLFSHQD